MRARLQTFTTNREASTRGRVRLAGITAVVVNVYCKSAFHSITTRGRVQMFSSDRRRFLHRAAGAGIAWSANSVFPHFLSAQTPAPTDDVARAYVDPRRLIAPLDRNLFGSFLEHLGRAIYEGIYDPGSKFSDASGFRKDVIDEIRRIGVPIIRYPGGNFVSGYNWLDGVGPKSKRPTVLERAWNSIEPNQFGTNEFIEWCQLVNTEPLLGFNLGTGTVEQAVNYVEYCNFDNPPELSGNSTARYLAMNLDMERQINKTAAVCDFVQGMLHSQKRLWLSFDEWNVWYRARGGDFTDGHRKFAPHLLEEEYNL